MEGLGLESAGVRFNQKGIYVDDRFCTSNHRIMAIADPRAKRLFGLSFSMWR